MTDMFKPTADVLSNGVSTVMASLEKTNVEAAASLRKSMKAAEDLVAFGQGNLAALTTSGQILAEGVQELGKTIAAQAQAEVEETVAVFKSFAGVTTVQGALELQTNYARAALARATAEATRLTEASRKLANDAMSPLTARATVAAETFSRAA